MINALAWRGAIMGLALVLLTGGLLTAAEFSAAGNPILTLQVGSKTVKAEVVQTPEKLFLGLGGRSELPWGTGMLFLMPRPAIQEFCMRGMLIPIDIIWIYRQQIIGFALNLQPDDLGTFISPGPADQVLEVPAGFVAASGLKVGDQVRPRP